MRRHRLVAAVAATLLIATALSGCGVVDPFLHRTFPEQFGPERGDDGAVTADIDVAVRYLQLDDCFDFPDEPDESRALIKPCDETHTFRVIAVGTVDLKQEQELGLQLAITQQCEDPFGAWAATMPAEARKDYKFLVREDEVDGARVKVFTCIAALQKLD